jgi:thiol:disulfide interchange protein
MTLLALVLALGTPALAQDLPSIPELEQSTAPTAPTGPFDCRPDPLFAVGKGQTKDLQLRLSVPEGHKMYLDAIGLEVKDSGGLTFGELTKPEGKDFMDPWTEENRPIYDGSATVTVPVTVPEDMKKGRQVVIVEMFWQGCKEGMCFPPDGRTMEVPVRVTKKRK